MSSNSIKPQNLPETIVWYYLIGTYVIYLLGAHYLATPFMGCVLLFYLGKQWWNQTEATPLEDKVIISPLAWTWFVAAIIIEVALIVGHLNFDLGIGQIIKSSSYWYRSWAVFAIFPLAGHLKIRPQIIYRAVCILCLQSIIVTVAGTLLSLIHIPQITYVSPLEVSGGELEHYQVEIIHTVIDNRLHLFAPWPTALGMAGNIFFYFSYQENNKIWRSIGIIGSLIMILFSWSRLAIVCLPMVLLVVWFLTNLLRPWVQLTTSFVSFLGGLFFVSLIDAIDWFKQKVDSIREDSSSSSRIREAIYSLTLDRWRSEAPLWGHGMNELKGPGALAHMPIGSHHTWFGLLYTHGLVGFMAFLVVVVWSLIDLMIAAQNDSEAKLGLSILLIILASSFSDNIQIFACTYWQGLLMIGIVWRNRYYMRLKKQQEEKEESIFYQREKQIYN